MADLLLYLILTLVTALVADRLGPRAARVVRRWRRRRRPFRVENYVTAG